MKSAFAVAVVFAMALVQPVVAKENYHEKQVNAETKEKFVDVVQSTQREMGPGGKYEFVQPKERVQIELELRRARFAQREQRLDPRRR